MSRLWRALTRNLLLKFSALVCATVVWVYVDSFVSDERIVSATVAMAPVDGWEFGFAAPPCISPGGMVASVKVTVRGPSRRVRLIEPGDIYAVVDDPGFSPPPAPLGTVLLSPRYFTIVGTDEITITDIEPFRLWVACRPSTKEKTQASHGTRKTQPTKEP